MNELKLFYFFVGSFKINSIYFASMPRQILIPENISSETLPAYLITNSLFCI